MKRECLATLMLILLGIASPALASDVVFDGEKEVGPGIYQVDSYLYRGGNMSRKRVDDLKKLGITSIVSFNLFKSHIRSEDKLCDETGMKCVHLPMWVGGPTDDQIKTFLQLVAQAKKTHNPLYIHCYTGTDRAGCMLGIYRLSQHQCTADEAIHEMRKHGYKPWFPHMVEVLRDYEKEMAEGKDKSASSSYGSSLRQSNEAMTGRMTNFAEAQEDTVKD